MALISGGASYVSFPRSSLGAKTWELSSDFAYPKCCWSPARHCGSLHGSQRPLSLIKSVSHRHTLSDIVPHPPQSRRRFAIKDTRRVLPIRAFLALYAVVSVAFLRRKHGTQILRSRNLVSRKEEEYIPTVMTAKQEGAGTNARKFDIHLHVWASPKQALEFPYFPGQEPTLPGHVEYLLEKMEEAGVDGALITQPINHKFDHSYVSSVLRKYPGKFVGCCLADPTGSGGGVLELERLIVQEGYRAVRFNPYLWPAGEKMTNEVGKAMFARAGELGAAVGFMCFKGLLLHVDDIEELCEQFRATKVMIDHFGFCKPAQSKDEEEAWRRLLGLARLPQVYVKASAFFRVSRESFPYRDTWPLVQQLVETFGVKRLMWGSDFPFVDGECGYTKACQELPSLMASSLSLSSEEWEWILGKSARELLAGTRQESVLDL